jgi:hypothetical protein
MTKDTGKIEPRGRPPPDPARTPDRQTLPGEPANQSHEPNLAAVMGRYGYERGRYSQSIRDRTHEAARVLRRRAIASGRPRTFIIRPLVS